MTTAFTLYTMKRFGYTAEQNGYLFVYIGVLAVLIQGGLFSKLAALIGESRLVVIGCIMLTASLFAVPFVRPEYGGLVALLSGIALFSIGNSIASPALTSLASKNASDSGQGIALGVMQSGASLARAIGPVLAGFLLNNAIGQLDDSTIQRTFFAASGIMLVAFVVAVYFVKLGKTSAAA